MKLRHRFLGLTCLLLLAASLAPLAGRAEQPSSDHSGPIAAKLQPFVDHHTLAGAVLLVATKDKVVDVETVGYADIATAKPMRPDNLFWIASQSKAMTAAALMILVDEGKVNVDDPVEKYLPEFKALTTVNVQVDGKTILTPISHPITVKNVLTHTSGLPFKSAAEQPTLDALPLADAVKSYTTSPLIFQPDTKYQYANAGINTAGRIIEVVSGMPYEKFMDERLFKPLSMTDTTFWPNKEQVARLAKSYKPNNEKTGLEETLVGQLHYPLTDHAHRFPMPAGGLFSTAGDVAKFCQMLLNGGELGGKRVLSAAAVQQMTSTQDGDIQNKGKGENGYGFGLQTSRKVHGDPQPGSGGSFGHGGAYSTSMQIDPAHGLIFVYMVQHAGYANSDGKQIQPTFQKAALDSFGKP
jgi:CubicO group peptidase (beta-lactamase class C family)